MRTPIQMPLTSKISLTFLVILASKLAIPTLSYADSLNTATQVTQQTNINAQKAQQQINQNDDQKRVLELEIEQLERELKDLSVYQQHLGQLIESQAQEKISIEQQLITINQTKQGLAPLMYRVLDDYAQLVEQGTPVQIESRQQRLADLQQLMTRADIAEAEKYRRILEAYQIEIDYGMKMGRYQGDIQLSDTDTRQVDILYIGRISLIARSQDNQQVWLWKDSDKQWHDVDNIDAEQLENAYALADKQQTPSVFNLPLSLSKIEQADLSKPSDINPTGVNKEAN